jgi:hypothetical protein
MEESLIRVNELRTLLIAIRGSRSDVCIRFRILGEQWMRNFVHVIHVTENGILLNDEVTNKFITISDISAIMQFEIDLPFQTYQPYYHYEVRP